MVLPLEQSNGSGGLNLPAYVYLPTDQFSTTFTLPTNVERAYLDVISQSQSTDEQWYGCFPNDLSAINEVYGCGNTDFRETEITIDGQPAGISPSFPWVYTGFPAGPMGAVSWNSNPQLRPLSRESHSVCQLVE